MCTYLMTVDGGVGVGSGDRIGFLRCILLLLLSFGEDYSHINLHHGCSNTETTSRQIGIVQIMFRKTELNYSYSHACKLLH